ncbi:HAD family hydrolase [Henriciella barbarensis]|uniref:HAD family hydrolase n=1 Tax=Henriciella barbarensis TaxID=86342 RepID=A0A399R875_9PROT|nr:HAD-IA family hydrolase [Henriciella barbarensis]RIJ25872.1 HAD family hydrolase [Henriciella barbarensis]
MTTNIQAVIWDFGGVLTSSPFEAFNRYEAEKGLPKDFIRGVNAVNGDTNAWAKLEQSKVTADEFDTLFRNEAEALGHSVPGKDILGLLSGDLRPRVVEALKRCKAKVKVGCITNNAPVGKGAGMQADEGRAGEIEKVFGLFDEMIESSKLGIRKPDPRIYALMCEALDVDPKHCVYLDDLGINLKPARAMGMTTIKVLNEDQLLSDLEAATGWMLTD